MDGFSTKQDTHTDVPELTEELKLSEVITKRKFKLCLSCQLVFASSAHNCSVCGKELVEKGKL